MCTLFITALFVNDAKSQVQEIDYQIRYNDQDCLWDFYIIIVQGNATTVPQRAQFNAQYSFVVPTGTVVGNPIGNLPIQNNQSYTGTTPTEWSYGAPAINPAASPGNDFYPVAPKLAPASFFNNLTEGDTVKIFSVSMSIVPSCGEGVRIFDNATDPNSSAPGMGGGNFSNGYTLGSPTQLYSSNEPTIVPPPPAVSATNLCSPGLQIDLTASTSTCQEPLTYAWSGPNGYSSTDEDVDLPSATFADAGTYTVTVTDAFGCESTLSIDGELKPDAGMDITGCANSTSNLQGTPNTGSWSADAGNPAGSTLTPGASGAATVDFADMAIGDYTFIYTGVECSDSVVISIVSPDAGPDPDDLTCFSSGTATLAATGTGTWSVGAGSAGTAVIADPSSNNTTVNDFSASGTYFLVWDIGACTDTVTIVTNDNCDCAISNNSLSPISPNAYCGTSGNITIDGGAVSASGSYAWEYSMNNGPFAAAPGTNNTEDYITDDLSEGDHGFRRIYITDTGVICSDTSNVVTFMVTDDPVAPENINASPQEICENETSTVSVDNVADATYTWTVTPNGSGAFLGTSNFITLDPFLPGVYTVTVFATVNGCPSPTSTIDVTVNEVPPAPDPDLISSTDPTICEELDGTITLGGYNASEDYTVSYDFMGVTSSPAITSDASGNLVITGLGAGTYSNFQVTSDQGCVSDVTPDSVVLSDPEAPDYPTGLMGDPNPECLGLPITISVDDVPGATFTWSASSPNAGLGNSTTNTVEMNATAAGIYNIFVNLTLNGCTSVDTFTSIQVNDAPPAPTSATVSSTDPGACGANDGFITLSGYEASISYDVTYSTNGVPSTVSLNSNSSGIITIPDLTEGTYSDFSVTNFTGCSSAVFPGPVSLADPGSPDAPANLVASPNPVCLGNTVTLSVDNTIGATYNWSASSPDAGLASSTSNNITMDPTAAGTFTISVSVTVAGCTSMSSSIEVIVGDTPPTPSGVTGDDPTECAGTDGFITLPGYISGGNYSLTYSDNGTPTTVMITANGSGEIILSDLSAGNYSDFVVTNAANCPSENFAGPIDLVDPEAPDAPTGLMTSAICEGETTTITADLVAGATYTWSVSPADAGFNANNTNEVTFTPTTNGIFSVSANLTIAGCTSASSSPVNVVVTESPDTPTDATISSTNPTACLASDGTISISGLNPSVSYGIELDSAMITINKVASANSAGVLTITGLPSGGYTNIILTNDLGCSSGAFSGPVVLSDPGAPEAPEDLVADPNPSCLGTEVNLSVTNTTDAIYTWSANDPDAGLSTSTGNTATMNALTEGVFTIFVSQTIAGCTSPAAMIDVTVLEVPPTPTESSVNGVDPSDCGVSNGTITLNSLSVSTTYTLSYAVNGTPTSVSVTSNGAGEIVLSDLGAGDYTDFSLENAGGCSSEVYPGPVSLVEPSAPSAPTAAGMDPSDCGVANGSITVSNLESTADIELTYLYNGSSVTGSFTTDAAGEIELTGLSVGTYSDFSYENSAGCTSAVFAGPVTLSEPNAPDAPTNLIADPNPVCLGEEVDLSVDQVAGATYNWSSSSSDAGLVSSLTNTTTMTATAAGTYTISVSLTIGGCQSAPVTIDVVINPGPDTPLDSDITFTDPTSCTTDDGTITIGGYTANTDYQLSYSFNGGLPVLLDVTTDASGAIVLSDLASGNYSEFTLTDGNGCTSGTFAGSIMLTQPGAPAAPSNLDGSPNPVCLGNQVALSVDPNPSATFEWTVSTPSAGLTSSTGNTATLDPTVSGIVTVSVTQTIAGCQSPPAMISILISENCLNPDFGVTYNGVDLTGDLSTNDNIVTGTTYGSPQAIAGNPNATLPTVNNDGTYTFTNTSVGEWYFTVEVCHPASLSNECTTEVLAITVLDIESTENPPVANHDYIYTSENIDIQLDIVANDRCQSFPNCDLTVSNIVQGPFSGSYDINTQTYSPNTNFVGRDSFLYEVCQSPSTPESCDQEWAYIDVYPSFATDFTNAMDDYDQTALNTPLVVDAANGLMTNDSDASNANQEITPVTMTVAGKGSIEIFEDGSYEFTPETGFVGPVDFPYTTCRENDGTICDNATLHILVEPMAATGSIASCVWEDTNGNGVFESGEPSVANVPVRLYNGLGELIAETVTDGVGNYRFDDVLQDVYFLEFELVEEFEFTIPNIGNDLNDSDVDDTNGPGTTTQFTLQAGQSIEDIKAGLFECTKIGNNIWYDVNENDIYDDTENGINGMRVFLWRRVNGTWVLWDETTSGQKPNSPSDDGYWEFCTAPGEYYIEINLPPSGLVQAVPFVGNDPFRDSDINNANGAGTTSSFNLQNGVDKLDLGAGYYPEAIVGNLVWHDENFDGIQNSDEARIAGVLVEAYDATSSELVGQSITNDEGIYQIDSLDKREVYFKFTPPSDMVATIADIGNDQIDSDVDHSFGLNTTRKIAMQPNTTNNQIDFGIAFGALPVKWISVDVSLIDKSHHLVWEVEQEINVEEYVVLRRHESETEFTRINNGLITSNNVLTRSRYSFEDSDIKLSGQYYYKVQQFDFDGKFNFSKTVNIDREVKLETSIYPNPTSAVSTLAFETTEDGEVNVTISDISGKIVRSISRNVEEGQHAIELNMTALLPGAYNVKIQFDGQVSNKRLIRIK